MSNITLEKVIQSVEDQEAIYMKIHKFLTEKKLPLELDALPFMTKELKEDLHSKSIRNVLQLITFLGRFNFNFEICCSMIHWEAMDIRFLQVFFFKLAMLGLPIPDAQEGSLFQFEGKEKKEPERNCNCPLNKNCSCDSDTDVLTYLYYTSS